MAHRTASIFIMEWPTWRALTFRIFFRQEDSPTRREQRSNKFAAVNRRAAASLNNVELITVLLSCNRQLAFVGLQLRIILRWDCLYCAHQVTCYGHGHLFPVHAARCRETALKAHAAVGTLSPGSLAASRLRTPPDALYLPNRVSIPIREMLSISSIMNIGGCLGKAVLYVRQTEMWRTPRRQLWQRR